MTIQEVLDITDQLRPNMMNRALKIRFLNELEGMIFEEIAIKHEPAERNTEGPFMAAMKERIESELLLQELIEKEEVLEFINQLRGLFHEEILKKQAVIDQTKLDFLINLEEILQARYENGDNFSKAELISFLENVAEALQAAIPVNAVRPVYNTETDPGTELLAPAPYDMCYVYWLEGRIDEQNQEMDKYNNDRALFENAYQQLSDWWNRAKMPVRMVREIRI